MKGWLCMHGRLSVVLMLTATTGLVACGDDKVLSGEGESCTKTADCVSGLKCVSMTCQQTGSSAPVETWFDPTSGLTWQVSPTGGAMNWSDAKAHCAGLSLDGGYWHLPTIGELRTLIRGCPATEDGGSCNVEEGDCLALSCRGDSCSGCSGNGDGGMYWPDEMQGDCCWYWSSSPVEANEVYAWSVGFYSGGVVDYGVVNDDIKFVRCVR